MATTIRRPARALTAALVIFSGLLVQASPAGAVPVLLHDQRGAGIGRISQVVSAPDGAFTSEAADDFTVPPGQSWQITEVTADGSSNTIDHHGRDFEISIASGTTEPAAVIFTQTVAAAGAGTAHTFPLAGAPVLEAGHYWLIVQSTSVPLGDQWFWQRSDAPLSGDPAVWRNPGDGFATGCTDWAVVGTCPANALGNQFSFSLTGELIDRSDPTGSCADLVAAGPQPGDIQGTPGHDILMGTPGDDVIWGFGGHDRIFGLGGNDMLVGGPGDDTIDGGDGSDLLCGEGDRDTLIGGTGSDGIAGGAGADRAVGGDGGDAIEGGAGNDVLDGQGGTNSIDGNAGTDRCFNPMPPAALNC